MAHDWTLLTFISAGEARHLHNFHSDLLRKDNFVASLAADVQKHLRDDYPDSRLTCPKRLCRGKAKPNGEDTISFKNYIGTFSRPSNSQSKSLH